MPLLDDTGLRADDWTRIEDDAPTTDARRSIIPLARARIEEAGLRASNTPLGLHIPNDADLDEIARWFDRAALISVAFPSFTDGRGFSIARRLRAMGYRGEIRAHGPVIADQFAYLRACGFDTVEIPEALSTRQPAAHWRTAAASVSHGYQRSYSGTRNILEARQGGQASGDGL